jgi:alkaline phosphatase D
MNGIKNDEEERMTRHNVLTVLLVCLLAASAGTVHAVGNERFPQSVASGDPTPDSVVLWTRIVPVDGVEWPRSLQVHVSTSDDFATLAADRTAAVMDAYDGVVKVRVDGLEPGTTYYYRFVNSTLVSPTGRTRTAPDPASGVPARFAVVYCQDYIGRYYNAYAKLLAEHDDDLDFVIHLGDYIYETTGDPSFQDPTSDRKIEFTHPEEAVLLGSEPNIYYGARSLSNYRDIYRTYRDDPVFQEVHERWPMVATWDDHEFTNDAWQDHATYFNGVVDERDPDRKRAAEQAWMEWVPTGAGLDADGELAIGADVLYPNTRIYGDFTWGSLLHLVLTDWRTFRPDHLIPEDALPGAVAVDEPTLRQILGDAAFEATRASFDPYIDFDAFAQALPIFRSTAILTTAGAIMQEQPSIDLLSAIGIAEAKLAGPMSVTFLNTLWEARGFGPLFPEGATDMLPRGVPFLLMGKTSFFDSFGSRSLVVKDTFELYAAKRWLETAGAAQDVWGPQQGAWLAGVLTQSPATWKILGNSVMMTPTFIDFTNPQIAALLPPEFPDVLRTRLMVNAEDFNGFPQKKMEMIGLAALAPGTVVISGDIHSTFVTDHGNGVFEFTGPAISSSTLGEISVRAIENDPLLGQIPGIGDLIRGFFSTMLQLSSNDPAHSSSAIAYAENFTHGYMIMDASADSLTATMVELPSNEVATDHTQDAAALDSLFVERVFTVQDGQLISGK